jgi:hypothetical protein
MFNAATTATFGIVFFILGDIFGTEGITQAVKQVISHFQ